MVKPFTLPFTPTAADIDELGHVNNAVWVRWIQDLATAHWNAVAAPEHITAYVWMVTRHEIDYRGNIKLGESAEGRTWISDPPRGAQFDRNVEFANTVGKVIVRAKTRWAVLDKESGRLVRVPKDVATPFFE